MPSRTDAHFPKDDRSEGILCTIKRAAQETPALFFAPLRSLVAAFTAPGLTTTAGIRIRAIQFGIALVALGIALGALRAVLDLDFVGQRGQAAYQALVARGMVYYVVGRVRDVTVSMVDGKTRLSGTAVEGEPVEVMFVKGSHNVFDFSRLGKRRSSLPSTPPSARPTLRPNPPNYESCKATGGATWFNEETGNGGCLGPGASKGFPCGIWAYSSPGRGRYSSWDGSINFSGFAWISTKQGACELGPLP